MRGGRGGGVNLIKIKHFLSNSLSTVFFLSVFFQKYYRENYYNYDYWYEQYFSIKTGINSNNSISSNNGSCGSFREAFGMTFLDIQSFYSSKEMSNNLVPYN